MLPVIPVPNRAFPIFRVLAEPDAVTSAIYDVPITILFEPVESVGASPEADAAPPPEPIMTLLEPVVRAGAE